MSYGEAKLKFYLSKGDHGNFNILHELFSRELSNNEIINDEKFLINKKLFNDKYLKLSIGKKRHLKIELN